MSTRHVDTSGLQRLLRELHAPGTFTGTEMQARQWKFAQGYPAEARKIRCQAGLHPVPINGSRRKGLQAGWFGVHLPDGTVGYLQRRLDDCVQASLSTLTQIPPHRIPDARIDAQLAAGVDKHAVNRGFWTTLEAWVQQQPGMVLTIHPTGQPPVTHRRWIAVTRSADAWGFNDHCLVMDRQDVLFEPHTLLPASKDDTRDRYDPDTVMYSITVE